MDKIIHVLQTVLEIVNSDTHALQLLAQAKANVVAPFKFLYDASASVPEEPFFQLVEVQSLLTSTLLAFPPPWSKRALELTQEIDYVTNQLADRGAVLYSLGANCGPDRHLSRLGCHIRSSPFSNMNTFDEEDILKLIKTDFQDFFKGCFSEQLWAANLGTRWRKYESVMFAYAHLITSASSRQVLIRRQCRFLNSLQTVTRGQKVILLRQLTNGHGKHFASDAIPLTTRRVRILYDLERLLVEKYPLLEWELHYSYYCVELGLKVVDSGHIKFHEVVSPCTSKHGMWSQGNHGFWNKWVLNRNLPRSCFPISIESGFSLPLGSTLSERMGILSPSSLPFFERVVFGVYTMAFWLHRAIGVLFNFCS